MYKRQIQMAPDAGPFKRTRWSDGRVARHSSAKAATAVRIRFRPQPQLITRCKSARLLFYTGCGVQIGAQNLIRNGDLTLVEETEIQLLHREPQSPTLPKVQSLQCSAILAA